MVVAMYKGVHVEGNWFSMGDMLWLELTAESTKKVGTDAVLESSLDKILDLKSSVSSNVIDVSVAKHVKDEKVKVSASN